VRERPVPARLQFARDQPIGRIGSIVLPEGAVGGVTRRFEWRISTRVNKPENDDPSIVEPIELATDAA
jgi:hypothetical protein